MDEGSLRSVSRGLLGNRHKLEILAAIATVVAEGEQDFYPRRISKLVPHAADNQVGMVMKQLHLAGLLIPVADKADQQRLRFRARECAIWEMSQALLAELQTASWEPEEFTE